MSCKNIFDRLSSTAVDNFLTTQQVADELGVTKARVIAMIRAGRLHAEKVGIQYLVKPADVDKVRDRKAGRPPKSKPDAKAGKGKSRGKGRA